MSNVPEPSRKPRQPILLRPLFQLFGFMRLIYNRMRKQAPLTALALVCIVLAVGLVTNTSFFTRAVDRVILTQELKDFSKVTGRPPFSTAVYYLPSSAKPVSLTDAEGLTNQVVNILTSKIGLPVLHQGLQISSGGMLLQPDKNSNKYATTSGYLDTIEVIYIAGVEQHIKITSGTAFDPKGQSSGDVVDVWMHDSYAQKLGANLGETFRVGVTLKDKQVTVRVVGLWHSTGRDSSFWFSDPDSLLDSSILIRRGDYIKSIQPLVPASTREVNWYIILDENKVRPADGAKYLDGFKQSAALISRILPGAREDTPPLDHLESFSSRSNSLTILLLGYNLPAFFILLYFLVLSSSIMARWQRQDMSLLVSRGMSVPGVLSLVILEQLMLFVVGYPLGIGFGMLVARVMGYTTSFLSFADKVALPVSLEDISLPLTFLALAFSLLARLSPAISVARQSKNVEERQWTHHSTQPFWYRYYLDLILILPTYYAYDQMVKHGSLGNLLVTNRPEDLYQDPLLILVPALFIITASLVLMRLFAIVMRLLDIPASWTPWLTIHLALRQLSRQSGDYLRPLMLVVVTLGLGVYTLSMAASLDQWLLDRNYYQAGADLTFIPIPVNSTTVPEDASWVPPVDEFRKLNGVAGVTRVGVFTVQINTDLVAKDIVGRQSAGIGLGLGQNATQRQSAGGGPDINLRLLALDRSDFASIAWFRPDFGQEPLGGMMNRLAATSDGILVPREILNQFDLQIGDQFPVTVGMTYSMKTDAQFTIVGTYDYFPTVFQEDGITLIGNLENINNLFGFTVPHSIWMKLQPGVSATSVLSQMANTLEVKPSQVVDTRVNIATEQGKMERVGIFGTLSIGFLATALMAILGLLIYSYASLRERIYHLAMLLAVGVSRAQVISQVVMEYAFLSLFGVVAGAAIGIYASLMFVPFFRFSGVKGAPIPLPPLIPIIAWPGIQTLTIAFTIIVVVAEVVTITLSIRERIGQLLKGV